MVAVVGPASGSLAIGGLSGYAVGRREPRYGTGDAAFYGGKLAADLSLPRLQAKWAAAGGGAAAPGPG